MKRIVFRGRNEAALNPDWMRTALISEGLVYLPLAPVLTEPAEVQELIGKLVMYDAPVLWDRGHAYVPVWFLERAVPTLADAFRDIKERALNTPREEK